MKDEELKQTVEEAEITKILAKRYGEREEYAEYNEEVAEEIYDILRVKIDYLTEAIATLNPKGGR